MRECQATASQTHKKAQKMIETLFAPEQWFNMKRMMFELKIWPKLDVKHLVFPCQTTVLHTGLSLPLLKDWECLFCYVKVCLLGSQAVVLLSVCPGAAAWSLKSSIVKSIVLTLCHCEFTITLISKSKSKKYPQLTSNEQ